MLVQNCNTRSRLIAPIASPHIMVNVVEEMYQCWNKNWIVFYVKFVLSTRNYGHACNRQNRPSGTMPKSSTESWEIKPSISRTLPHSKRSSCSGAKYGKTTRPITMCPLDPRPGQGKPACPNSGMVRHHHRGDHQSHTQDQQLDSQRMWLTSGSNNWPAYTPN